MLANLIRQLVADVLGYIPTQDVCILIVADWIGAAVPIIGIVPTTLVVPVVSALVVSRIVGLVFESRLVVHGLTHGVAGLGGIVDDDCVLQHVVPPHAAAPGHHNRSNDGDEKQDTGNSINPPVIIGIVDARGIAAPISKPLQLADGVVVAAVANIAQIRIALPIHVIIMESEPVGRLQNYYIPT